MLVTFYPKRTIKGTQAEFEQLLFGDWNEIEFAPQPFKTPRPITAEIKEETALNTYYRLLTQNVIHLRRFNEDIPVEPERRPLYNLTAMAIPTDRSYKSFRIPKRSDPHKFRQIDEPNPDLKTYLRFTKECLEQQLRFITHDAAHAYVKERNVVTAMQRHQENKSRWFLKLDLKDFFPKHNKKFILDQMNKVFPFGIIRSLEPKIIEDIVDAALLNDSLPQGTPLSPLISNITMVPIDHAIYQALKAERNHYVYTRYADDIIISCKVKFKPENVISIIRKILNDNNAPFRINEAKTRFGSSNGRNWNLGLMYNKDMELTVGHKNNQKLRAALFQFFMDNSTTGKHWGIMETQKLIGLLAWYRSVQPERTENILRKYEEKFNRKFKDLAAEVLNPIQ